MCGIRGLQPRERADVYASGVLGGGRLRFDLPDEGFRRPFAACGKTGETTPNAPASSVKAGSGA